MFTTLDYHIFNVSNRAPPAPPSVVFIILSSLSHIHAALTYIAIHTKMWSEHVFYKIWSNARPLLLQDRECRELHFYNMIGPKSAGILTNIMSVDHSYKSAPPNSLLVTQCYIYQKMLFFNLHLHLHHPGGFPTSVPRVRQSFDQRVKILLRSL